VICQKMNIYDSGSSEGADSNGMGCMTCLMIEFPKMEILIDYISRFYDHRIGEETLT
jgi:hypothetical protein